MKLTIVGAVSPSTKRSLPYRPLGALRLFLALLVMLQHYVQWSYPGFVQRAVMAFLPGNTAVLVFFFLSGFVITEAADLVYGQRPAAFLLNRLLRIVPLFGAAIVVSFAALYALNNFVPLTNEKGDLIPYIFTASNLARNLLIIVPLPGRFSLEPDFSVLRIAWALRIEMTFYAWIALLLLAAKLQRTLSFRTLYITTSAVLLALFSYHFALSPVWNPIVTFVPYFCAGGALFFTLTGSKASGGLFAIAIVSSLLAAFQATIGPTDINGSFNPAPIALFAVLIVTCILLAAKSCRRHSSDRFLGDLSYPVYVGHWLPLLIFAALIRQFPEASGPAGQLACTIAGLALPVCYFILIEPKASKMRTLIRGIPIR